MSHPPFLDIPPLRGAAGSVMLPGSKSISNRVLLLAMLCAGDTCVHDLLDSDDTRVMLTALTQLGCTVQGIPGGVRITGLGLADDAHGSIRPPTPHTRLHLGNAGTAMRPLTAALALLGQPHTLTGVTRMQERPIGDLVDALRQLGCRIDYLGQAGYPPLALRGTPQGMHLPPAVTVRGDVSSQFLTALLMALPIAAQRLARDAVIEVEGELISKPYIDITLHLMARFGVAVQRDGWQRFTIPSGSHYTSPGTLHVEADASSASYFIAMGAIASTASCTGGVTVKGVGQASIQGDIHFVEAARRMGAEVEAGPNWLRVRRAADAADGLRPIALDCNHMPDAAMTLAMMALYARGTSRLTHIGSWRVKETDRIAAMATELRKLGADVVEGSDFIEITPPAPGRWRDAALHTYDDHRMAMCASLAAFNPDGRTVRIQDPGCVAKTFPAYFDAFFSLVVAEPSRIPVLCIDGPTASGKGTLSTRVAQQLGYHHLDSGALYRILGLAAARAGLPLDASAETAIAALASRLDIAFRDGRAWLNGEDVDDAIRSEGAGMNASRVSALPAVRAALVELQHRFRRPPGLVADGRDMGTVIFPDAALKVYLTANTEQRAERRYKQLIQKGIPVTLATLRADLLARDDRDTNRAVAPLKPAEDAALLDNSDLSIDQSVEWVLSRWHRPQHGLS